MAKYVCTICGYVYDEEMQPDSGMETGTKWEQVPRDWNCPLCGATKSAFEPQKAVEKVVISTSKESVETKEEVLRELSVGELSAIFSNLGKGCEKQYLPEEAKVFFDLALYYKNQIKCEEENSYESLLLKVEENLKDSYRTAKDIASNASDRGSLRALVWSEKVTKIMNSLLTRYEKEGEAAFKSTNIYVCEICGFIYIGEEAPSICPVCKVPKSKITKIKRG